MILKPFDISLSPKSNNTALLRHLSRKIHYGFDVTKTQLHLHHFTSVPIN